MTLSLTIKNSILIDAPAAMVWDALTNPEQTIKYMFGCKTVSDWKKGSPILYKGIYEGKAYEDKGNILDIEKEKFILYNYWSSFSGTENIPENYSILF